MEPDHLINALNLIKTSKATKNNMYKLDKLGGVCFIK